MDAPSFEKARLRIFIALVVLDQALLAGSFYLAAALYEQSWVPGVASALMRIFLPLLLITGIYQRAYSRGAISDFRTAASAIGMAYLWAVLAFFTITFYDKSTSEVSRVIFTLGSAIGLLSILALRALTIAMVRRELGPTAMNVLVIEAGGPPVALPYATVVDANELHLHPDPESPETFNRFGRLTRDRDEVLVSCSLEDRAKWAFALRAAGVRGAIVSDRIQELGAYALKRHDNFTELAVSLGPLALKDRVVKRAFDTGFTLALLAVIWPLLAAIAIAIKLDDGGAILFRQPRVGRGNRFFEVFKFRTMREDQGDRDGKESTARNDARITRIGGFLRRTSLDELPQFFNVLRGEMSIVGPRPHAIHSRAGSKLFWEIDQSYWVRHSLKPGITGLAQVRGFRGATEHEHDLTSRLKSDLAYQEDWTIWRDLLIVLMTVRVLVHRNAF